MFNNITYKGLLIQNKFRNFKGGLPPAVQDIIETHSLKKAIFVKILRKMGILTENNISSTEMYVEDIVTIRNYLFSCVLHPYKSLPISKGTPCTVNIVLIILLNITLPN